MTDQASTTQLPTPAPHVSSDPARAGHEPPPLDADLERLVNARTATLEESNFALTVEIEHRKALEEELRRAEELANDLIRYAPTAIYEIDFRGPRFTRVNDAMCAMSGYTREELLATSPFALLDEESRNRFAERIRRTFAGEAVDQSVDYTCIVKDGRVVNAVLQTTVKYDRGKPIGALVIAHDVTERKRAEQILRESRERMSEELADSKTLQSISSRLVVEQDTRGLYEEILKAAIALARSDAGSLQILNPETNSLDLIAWKGFHAESAAFWQTVSVGSSGSCGAALKSRERVIVPDVDTCEWMAGTEDETHVRRSGIRAMQSTPLMSRTGGLLGMISTHWFEPHVPSDRVLHYIDVLARQAADLVERKQAEEALRQSEAKYRTLFESIDEGYFVIDVIFDEQGKAVDLYYVEANAAATRMLGQDWTGKRLCEIDASFEPYWFEVFGAVARTGASVRLEGFAKALDMWFDYNVFKIGGPESGRIGNTFRDITARKRAEAERTRVTQELAQQKTQLEVANKELESFSYSVSHDLRTPLGAVQSIAQMLEDEYGSALPPAARRYVDLIRSGTREMDELIKSLLALSRLGRQPVQKQRVNMNGLVMEALDTLHPGPSHQGLTLNIGNLTDAEADPVLLKQVWVNLIANAVKFTGKREKPQIDIGCEACDGETRVYFVRDNGVGFAMEQADRLFGVFQRLHSEDDYEGLGVGLAIVQRIVHRHGGRVWADGYIDRGATFYFTLA